MSCQLCSLLCQARTHERASSSHCRLNHCQYPDVCKENSKIIYSADSASEDSCLTVCHVTETANRARNQGVGAGGRTLVPPQKGHKVCLVSQVKESIRARNKIKIVSCTQSLRLYCQMKSHFIDRRLSKIPDLNRKLVGP